MEVCLVRVTNAFFGKCAPESCTSKICRWIRKTSKCNSWTLLIMSFDFQNKGSVHCRLTKRKRRFRELLLQGCRWCCLWFTRDMDRNGALCERGGSPHFQTTFLQTTIEELDKGSRRSTILPLCSVTAWSTVRGLRPSVRLWENPKIVIQSYLIGAHPWLLSSLSRTKTVCAIKLWTTSTFLWGCGYNHIEDTGIFRKVSPSSRYGTHVLEMGFYGLSQPI